VQRVNEQDAHADVVGGGQRRQDGIAHEEPTKARVLCLGIDGKASHQHRRDRVGCVASYLARKIGMLDRDSRKRVVPQNPVGPGVHADIAAAEVGKVIGEGSVCEVAVE